MKQLHTNEDEQWGEEEEEEDEEEERKGKWQRRWTDGSGR